MASPLEPEIRNEASNEIRHQYLSAAKARQVLGWSPLFSLDEALGKTIEWYRFPWRKDWMKPEVVNVKADSQKWAAGSISRFPVEVWLFVGLLVSLVVFQLMPTFFRYDDAMAQGLSFITPAKNMVGADHYEIVTDMSRAFFVGEPRFVLRGPYPPLTILFHALFIPFDKKTSFVIISLLTLAALLFSTLVLPARVVSREKKAALLVALFLTGFFSYGFQFEIERGQYNLINFCFLLASIWLFHRHPNKRWLAYTLFTLAVQLKVYPAIFVINLVDDWRDWKGIARRFIGLGLVNFALLFIFGYDNFLRFLSTLTRMATLNSVDSVNHSIGSFIGIVIDKAPQLAPYTNTLLAVIVAFTGLCFLLIIYQSYKNNRAEINPFLIMVCTVIAQLIPRVSSDYTLSMLPAAMAFFLLSLDQVRKNLFVSLSFMLVAAAYGSTLFSNYYKYAAKEIFPILTPFSNNFPALFILLVLVTVLSLFMLPGPAAGEK